MSYEQINFSKLTDFTCQYLHLCVYNYVDFLHIFLVKICHNITLELSAHLEAKNTSCQLDRDQRKEHTDSLVVALSKFTDALVKIADKL